MSDSVLVIGGGIAGIQASLDLAKAGAKVVLVEKSPTIGGKMAVLDKNFPTLDCSICLPGDEDVILGDGTILPIREVVEKLSFGENAESFQLTTPSLREHALKLQPISKGQKIPSPPFLIEVKTKTGGSVRMTPDHNVLVDGPEGPYWVAAADVKPGDRLYSPRKLSIESGMPHWVVDLINDDFLIAGENGTGPAKPLLPSMKQRLVEKFGTLAEAACQLGIRLSNLNPRRHLSKGETKKVLGVMELEWEEVRGQVATVSYSGAHSGVHLKSKVLNEDLTYVLGLLASDGNVSPDMVRFYNTEKELIERYVAGLNSVFKNPSAWTSTADGPANWKPRQIVCVKNKVLYEIAQRLAIKSHLKPIFALPENLIASFVRGYFDGDGAVSFVGKARRSAKVYFTVNKDKHETGWGLHLLLKRLGIMSKVYTYKKRIIVDISERKDVARFIDTVGTNHPVKKKRFEDVRVLSEEKKVRGGLFEEMPLYCGRLIGKLRERYKIPHRVFPPTHVNLLRVTRGKCRITRLNLERILNSIDSLVSRDDADYMELARAKSSEFFLDPVKSARRIPSTDEYVYDVTVDETHSFIPRGAFVVANCIEAPKMSEVGQNKNIEIFSPAEVELLEGKPGEFKVTIRQKERMVTSECTRCDLCTQACPVVVPNEADSAMAFRKAIYTPITQAVPGPYLVDLEHCLNKPPHYMPCQKCVEVCLPKCINFEMARETVHTRDVGAVVVSAGYDLIDPEILKEYGYGTHPDIMHSLELERLLTSAGPTGGEILKPSNGHHPKNMLLVLCVGSRDHRHYKYCSRFCCMYSAKHAFQLMDHGVKDVTVLYMDQRAFGKGFDEFWKRTANEGTKFIRGRPASIAPNPDNSIKVVYEDTKSGKLVTQNFDLVSLSHAVTPPKGMDKLAKALGVEIDEDGFLQAVEEKGGLIYTTRPGVYAAGCISGPKDIPDSVAEGGAAATLSLGHLTSRSWPKEEKAEPIQGIETPKIGVFVCHCGSNIAGVVDVAKVAEFAKTLEGVVHSQTQMFSCAGNTQAEIEQVIKEKGITRVVIAACSPKTHEETFRGVCRRAGLNPYLLVMSNIRNMDSWVHKEHKEAATEKANDMVRMAVEHARLLTPLYPSPQPVIQKALIIGGGIAGMAAASAIARQGYETHLVEKEKELGGVLRNLEEIAPANLKAKDVVGAQAKQVKDTGVNVHLGTTVDQIGGFVGNFHAKLSSGEDLKIGAVILAMGALPYEPNEFGYGQKDGEVLTNLELEKRIKEGKLTGDKITFISCVGSRKDKLGCSRYCCASMVGQALHLRRMGKKVRVLYKDIRTFSRHTEEIYEQACREGVQFFRYDPDMAPEQAIRFEEGSVIVKDELTGQDIRIPTDHLVLTLGLKPTEETISTQLKLPKSQDGFLLELHPKLGPAETASQGIYLAGTVQYPKDVRETVAQALAAASKASALLSKDAIEKEPLTAQIDPEKCKKCFACAKVCPFGAIETTGKPKEGTVKIIEAACMGCGNCAGQCNFGAIIMPYFTREHIFAQIDAALKEKPEEKVMVFTCNWCSYAGADQAGIEKIQYPPSSRIIRTMCSARFEQSFVARCFEKGAGAVLITGCRLTDEGSDCHYNYANTHTWKRFKTWQMIFSRKGISEERLQLRWISAAEGKEFAAKMREMHSIVMKNAEKLRKERKEKEKAAAAK